MKRRSQQLSREKSRTMWLVWCAWGVIGSIFLFEDTKGGSGWLTLILTAPFWFAFVCWPFLWFRLRFFANPEWVELDDDIVSSTHVARVLKKNGVRYVDADAIAETFQCSTENLQSVSIVGGDERFAKLSDVRALSQDNPALKRWIAAVDEVTADR